jgi:uncharacterized protein YcfL
VSSISGQSKKSELNPLKIHIKYLHILENQLSASQAAISHQQPSVLSSHQSSAAISRHQPSATSSHQPPKQSSVITQDRPVRSSSASNLIISTRYQPVLSQIILQVTSPIIS